MKITVQKQATHDHITSVTLTHPRTGYQVKITPGPRGFVAHSSQGMRVERYDNFSYELLSEVGGKT